MGNIVCHAVRKRLRQVGNMKSSEAEKYKSRLVVEHVNLRDCNTINYIPSFAEEKDEDVTPTYRLSMHRLKGNLLLSYMLSSCFYAPPYRSNNRPGRFG